MSFEIGKAPWEVGNQETQIDKEETVASFPIGKAPWEVEGQETLQVDNTVNERKEALRKARELPKNTDGERELRDQAIRDASRLHKELTSSSITGGDPRAADFTKGVASTVLGGAQLGLDIADKIGIDVEELSEDNLEKIKYLNDNIKDESFFSANTAGKIAPTLATLPVAFSAKATAFAVEGALAYSESRGSGNSELGSLLTGVAVGAGTAGVMKVFEYLGSRGSKVYQEVSEEFALGTKAEQKAFRNYSKFTGKDNLTYYDKTMAILAQGKDKGAAYMKIAGHNDAKAKKALDHLSRTRGEAVERATDGNSVARAIKPLLKQQAFASNKYSEFKSLVFGKGPQDVTFERSKILEELGNIPELQKTPIINKVMRKLEGDKQVGLDDLFDVREAMNGVTMKMRRIDKAGKQTIDGRQYVDSIISANMPDEFAPVWGTLKDELRLAYATKGANSKETLNNVFGKLLSDVNTGNRTYSSILEDVAASSGGPAKFKDIMKAIGTDKSIQFEKGLVKEIYSGTNKDLGKTVERLKDLGFVTPEGKQLSRELRLLDDAFSADDFYKVVADALETGNLYDGTSITANLLSKFKYSVMSNVWDNLKQFAPTEKGQFLRHMKRVTKAIVKAQPEVKGINNVSPEIYKSFKGVIRESVEKTINEEIQELNKALDIENINKSLDGKPLGLPHFKQKPSGDVNLETLTATQKGTVSTDQSEGIIKDRLDNIINDRLKDDNISIESIRESLNNDSSIFISDEEIKRYIKNKFSGLSNILGE